MKTILAAVCGSLCLLSVSSARADIAFCNNYSSQIWVAVGLWNLNNGLNCDERFGRVDVIGWYSMTPGHCATVISGCYNDQSFDFHAAAADGARWAGGIFVATLSNSAFEFCAGTSPLVCAPSKCPPMNHGNAGFRDVLLGDGCGFLGWNGYEGTIDLN